MKSFRIGLYAAWVLVAGALFTPAAADLTVGFKDAYLRVVDVGPGLCVVAEIPGPHYLVYDAGHWVGGRCHDAVQEIVDGDEIDLLVLSHPDSDHLGDAAAILGDWDVRLIVRTGLEREGVATWKKAHRAAAKEARDGASIWNLQTMDLVPGTSVRLGEATVTFLAGWGEWPEAGLSESEARNVISVVARLDYRGRSILLTGDTIGRRRDDDDDACKDAERVLVDLDRAGVVELAADVLIAPHHGGNNGSSACFIQAVDPEIVVFSAGHDHGHPSAGAAGRYLAHGLAPAALLRTDRGDDEGGFEWTHGAIAGCVDPRGDDDVDVVFRGDGTFEVAYRMEDAACE